MDTKKTQPIFLWAVPRSLSTAFLRSMESRSNTTVLLEPFAKAYFFGEERISKRYADTPIEKGMRFLDIRQELEDAESEPHQVFIKEMAFYLRGHPDPLSLLPEGYQHTFLIRDPHKSIPSFYKMCINTDMTGWTYFDPNEAGFKELWELYCLLRTKLGRPPLVIDADDLLNDPEGYLHAYCDWTGLTYEDKMMKWDPAEKSMLISSGWEGWLGDVLGTSTFLKPLSKKPHSSLELPDSVVKSIEDNLVYYNNFQKVKLRLIE